MPNKEREPSRFTVAERALFAGLVAFVVVTFAVGAAHRGGWIGACLPPRIVP